MVRIPNYSPDRLLKTMIHTVNANLDESSLNHLAEQFIIYKKTEGFSFSTLTQLHFHIDSSEKHEGMYDISAAIEFLILALDILDDLQDEDADDKPWTQVSSAASMNLSTGFLMMSMKLIQEAPFQRDISTMALQSLHDQVLQAVRGQHVDLCSSSSTEEEFLTMMKNKSGSLMACACMIGAAFQDSQELSVIRLYSESFGVAAQLGNDLQDLLRFDAKNDLINKKWTLPVFMLMKESGVEAGWIRDYYEGRVDQEFITERKQPLFDWVAHSPIIPYIQVLVRKYQRKAIGELELLQVSQEWKRYMEKVIEDL